MTLYLLSQYVADSGSVAESAGTAQFKLTATGLTVDNTPLLINATPAEDTGDFLTEAIADEPINYSVIFSDPDQDDIYTGTFAVALHNDTIGEVTGDIKLSLNTKPTTYQIGATSEGTISILDDDAPEITISANYPTVTEAVNAEAIFTISAQVSPTSTYTLHYNVAVSPNPNVGEFIDSSKLGDKSKTIDLRNGNTETITIAIENDDMRENDSILFVRLLDESGGIQNYTVDSSLPRVGVHTILTDDESLPALTIADTTSATAENTGDVDFILSTTADPGPSLMVRYQPAEVASSNFLNADPTNNQEDIDTQSVDFASTDGGLTYTGTLTVPIHNDEIGEDTGQIQITLLSQTGVVKTYQVDSSNNIGMATIWDDDAPIISIDDAPAAVESDNAEIRFPVTALVSPNTAIRVYYELVESSGTEIGDFIEPEEEGTGKFKSVSFANNATSGVLAIPIDSDEVQERGSTVTVTLESHPNTLETANYNLPATNNPATATVSDDDLPVVSIETRYDRVADADYVEYLVTAAPLTYDLTVTLNVVTGTSIVNTTTSDSLTIDLTSSAPSATQRVRFNTGRANNSLVEIGFATDSGYTIDSDNSQISFRVDNGASFPAISLGLSSSQTNGISEGSNATFSIYSSLTLRDSPLPITIAVTEESTNFLATLFPPPAIIAVGQNWLPSYQIPTLSDGVDGDTDGTFTVEILPGPNYKLKSTNTSATVTVLDDGSDQQAYLYVSIIAPQSTLAGEPFDVILRARPILRSGQSIDVTYTMTESGHETSYLNHTPTPVTITDANNSESTISIDTHRNGDGTGDKNGALNILVRPQSNDIYTASTTAIGVRVLDPDLLPEVSISRISPATIEEGEQAIFELSTASPVAGSNIEVSYNVEKSGTGDFIDAGEFGMKVNVIDHTTNKYRIELDTIPDAVAEGNGTITITVQEDPKKSNPRQDATYILGSNITESVTINDNDGLGLGVATVSRVTERVIESEDAEFTFALSPPPTGDAEVTVYYKVVDSGSFLANAIDPTSRQSINIDSSGSAKLELETASDDIKEDPGSVMVEILSETGGATNYSVGINYHDTITIISDDDPGVIPLVDITASQRTITEGTHDRATFTFTVADGATPSDTITVFLKVEQEGNFLRDAPDTREVRVTTGTFTNHLEYIVDDEFDQSDGRIIATILPDKTGPVDYAIGIDNKTDVTVVDDDDPPTISINDPTAVNEGNETNEDVSITFDVALSKPSLNIISVEYVIGKTGDTATEDVDYVDGSGTLEFEPLDTSMPIVVSIHEEMLHEGDEQFTIVLSDPTTGIVITKTEGIGTITDDDPVPTVSVTSLSERVGEESGPITIPVTLSNPTKETVMIDWAIIPETASSSDYSLDLNKLSPLVISSGDTTGNIEIDITSDNLVEGNETFIVELSNPRHARIIGDHGMRRIKFTIWDDESLQSFSIFAVGGQPGRSICGMRPTNETEYLNEDLTEHSAYRELLANRNLGAKGCQQEGTDVQFRVIASSPPATDIPLRIIVSQVGDFILAPTAGSSSLAEGNNNVIFKAGKRVETYIVQTKRLLNQAGIREGVATGDGKITAELQSGITNNSNPKATSAEVTIWDIDRPRISIVPISVSGVDEGAEAKFKVSADPFPSENSFDVRVNVSEFGYDGVDFLMSTDEGEATVTLTPKTETIDGTQVITEYTGELSVPTQPDEVDEYNGSIVATILTSTTYNINPLPEFQTAVVRVRDNDGAGANTNDLPLVSVAPVSAVPITEGGIAQFTLTATKAVSTAYTIELGLTSTGGDFIDRSATNVTHIRSLTQRDENNNLIVVPVSFVITQVEMPANRSSVAFSIQTLGDEVDEPDGSIIANIIVDNSDRYRIFTSRTGTARTPLTNPFYQFTNRASIQVLDNDSVPEISIAAVTSGSIAEGTDAEFIITANRLSHLDKVIQVSFNDGTSDFIDTETLTEVTIPAGSLSATYIVKTNDDEVGEDDGKIDVTLVSEVEFPVSYTVSPIAYFAQVSITDNDGGVVITTPNISVSADVTAIVEGDNAKFYFTTPSAPSTAIGIAVFRVTRYE